MHLIISKLTGHRSSLWSSSIKYNIQMCVAFNFSSDTTYILFFALFWPIDSKLEETIPDTFYAYSSANFASRGRDTTAARVLVLNCRTIRVALNPKWSGLWFTKLLTCPIKYSLRFYCAHSVPFWSVDFSPRNTSPRYSYLPTTSSTLHLGASNFDWLASSQTFTIYLFELRSLF